MEICKALFLFLCSFFLLLEILYINVLRRQTLFLLVLADAILTHCQVQAHVFSTQNELKRTFTELSFELLYRVEVLNNLRTAQFILHPWEEVTKWVTGGNNQLLPFPYAWKNCGKKWHKRKRFLSIVQHQVYGIHLKHANRSENILYYQIIVTAVVISFMFQLVNFLDKILVYAPTQFLLGSIHPLVGGVVLWVTQTFGCLVSFWFCVALYI